MTPTQKAKAVCLELHEASDGNCQIRAWFVWFKAIRHSCAVQGPHEQRQVEHGVFQVGGLRRAAGLATRRDHE